MADVTLSDGKEINFDLRLITYREYKGLFDVKEPEEKSDETIARVSGLTYEEFMDISFYDRKLLLKAFFKKCREPLADPNSQSAST